MTERSCRDVRADLSALLEGDLDPATAAAARAHLERCSSCRSELEELRLTIGALRRLPELAPPADILAGVRSRLRPLPWYRRLLVGREWSPGFPLGAVATLLVVVGVALFQARYPGLDQAKDALRREAPAPAAPSSSPPAKPATPAPAPASEAFDGPAAPAGRPAPTTAPPPPQVTPLPNKVPEQAELPTIETNRGSRLAGEAQPEQPPPAPAQVPGASSAPPAAPPAAAPPPPAQPAEASVPTPVTAQQRGEKPPPDARDDHVGTTVAPQALEKKGDVKDAARGAVAPEAGRRTAAMKLKAAAPDFGQLRVVCLLAPGDSVEELRRLLLREGVGGLETRELDPPAIEETFAPHRGRLGRIAEPVRGWTLTAGVAAESLERVVDLLAKRPGLRLLERPALPGGGVQRVRFTLLQ